MHSISPMGYNCTIALTIHNLEGLDTFLSTAFSIKLRGQGSKADTVSKLGIHSLGCVNGHLANGISFYGQDYVIGQCHIGYGRVVSLVYQDKGITTLPSAPQAVTSNSLFALLTPLQIYICLFVGGRGTL